MTVAHPVQDNMGILDDGTIPEKYNNIPSNENYAGPYNFDTSIDPRGTKSVMYSDILNKVFIISHSNFMVDFKWENPVGKIDFFVRAMPLYSSPQDAHKPVITCVQHRVPTENGNAGVSKLEAYHILRCISDQTQYTGGTDRHLSVLVPLGLPQAGMETVRHTYYFVCKNSCTTGMNRRAVDVVFTLEDVEGNIYGRKKISVRICSCPKRDKGKEEEEHMKNNGQSVPKGKKRKTATNKKPSFTDPNDTGIYTISMEIVGKANAKSVLKYAYGLMATEVLNRDHAEPFQTFYDKLGNALNNIAPALMKEQLRCEQKWLHYPKTSVFTKICSWCETKIRRTSCSSKTRQMQILEKHQHNKTFEVHYVCL